jgi:hypothetical protein
MTIGIGYQGTSWTLLGSDMELTGVEEYRGNKHYYNYFDKDRGVVAAVYAGSEDEMRCLWEELSNQIESHQSTEPLQIRSLLEQALQNSILDPDSQFQMLVAISHPDHNQDFLKQSQPYFFRIFKTRVTPAKGWELIGGADCGLTRYLTSMQTQDISVSQAFLSAIRVIGLANRFVQGVRRVSC